MLNVQHYNRVSQGYFLSKEHQRLLGSTMDSLHPLRCSPLRKSSRSRPSSAPGGPRRVASTGSITLGRRLANSPDKSGASLAERRFSSGRDLKADAPMPTPQELNAIDDKLQDLRLESRSAWEEICALRKEGEDLRSDCSELREHAAALEDERARLEEQAAKARRGAGINSREAAAFRKQVFTRNEKADLQAMIDRSRRPSVVTMNADLEVQIDQMKQRLAEIPRISALRLAAVAEAGRRCSESLEQELRDLRSLRAQASVKEGELDVLNKQVASFEDLEQRRLAVMREEQDMSCCLESRCLEFANGRSSMKEEADESAEVVRRLKEATEEMAASNNAVSMSALSAKHQSAQLAKKLRSVQDVSLNMEAVADQMQKELLFEEQSHDLMLQEAEEVAQRGFSEGAASSSRSCEDDGLNEQLALAEDALERHRAEGATMENELVQLQNAEQLAKDNARLKHDTALQELAEVLEMKWQAEAAERDATIHELTSCSAAS